LSPLDRTLLALPPSELEQLLPRVREQLRARARATRRALVPSAVAARSARIVEALSQLPPLQQARTVGLFWPRASHGEVDLRPFDRSLRERGVSLYYPFMDPKGPGAFTTGFRHVERVEQLQQRGRGFAEPDPDARVAVAGELDVVIVPALAASPDGHRLGFGSGFYDVTLPDLRPPALAVIVVFSFQLLAEFPTLEHDVACDVIVTDREIYDCRGVLAREA
jgi:5-formyltetrahydrofolate cyclo-ligase